MEIKDECYPATAKNFDEAIPKGDFSQIDIIVGSQEKLNNLEKLWKWFFEPIRRIQKF